MPCDCPGKEEGQATSAQTTTPRRAGQQPSKTSNAEWGTVGGESPPPLSMTVSHRDQGSVSLQPRSSYTHRHTEAAQRHPPHPMIWGWTGAPTNPGPRQGWKMGNGDRWTHSTAIKSMCIALRSLCSSHSYLVCEWCVFRGSGERKGFRMFKTPRRREPAQRVIFPIYHPLRENPEPVSSIPGHHCTQEQHPQET